MYSNLKEIKGTDIPELLASAIMPIPCPIQMSHEYTDTPGIVFTSKIISEPWSSEASTHLFLSPCKRKRIAYLGFANSIKSTACCQRSVRGDMRSLAEISAGYCHLIVDNKSQITIVWTLVACLLLPFLEQSVHSVSSRVFTTIQLPHLSACANSCPSSISRSCIYFASLHY